MIAIIAFVSILVGVTNGQTCSTAYNFDYLLLAIQWPASFCLTQACAAHSDVWSIHGGWPEYNNNSWPQDCCFDNTFNASTLSSIRTELSQKWLTLSKSGTNEEFWSHEWLKHGTCAMNSELLRGELNYFSSVLAAFNGLAIEKWLKDAGITPSNTKTYNVSEFHAALSAGLGHKVGLVCLSNKVNSAPVLSQISFCLNKTTLKPFDCSMADEKCGNQTISYITS